MHTTCIIEVTQPEGPLLAESLNQAIFTSGQDDGTYLQRSILGCVTRLQTSKQHILNLCVVTVKLEAGRLNG